MGEMRRMVDLRLDQEWTPALVGVRGGRGKGRAPRGPGKEVRLGREKLALKREAEKEELAKTKLPRVMFATINHVFKVGDSWKYAGANPVLPPVMEHAEAVGKQCYVLGQQMFAAEAWKECQRPLRRRC